MKLHNGFKIRSDILKILQENILEILLLIGISLVSIGFFMFSIPLGFIASGILVLIICIIVWKEEVEGGGD